MSSNLQKYGQISKDLLHQLTDSRFQLDLFDNSSMLHPAHSFKPTSMPANIVASATHYSQSSPFYSFEVPLASDAWYLPETVSMNPQQTPLIWDSMSYDTLHPESFQVRHYTPKGVLKNENATTITTTPAKEQNRLSESLKWQHISSTELKPHEVIKDIENPRKVGRRHGRLNVETARNAQQMRHLRACLPCSIQKKRVG